MIHVRHRTASGRLDEVWEFDPVRKCMDIVFRLGSAKPVAFTLPICAIDKPRLHAFAISRLDGESWRLLPSRFMFAGDKLVHVEVAIHHSLDKRTMLVLSRAPSDVDAELDCLSL